MSTTVPDFLSAAAAGPATLTIRALLEVWGFRARTFENVSRVASDLSAAGLACTPDVASGDLSTLVTVGPIRLSAEASVPPEEGDTAPPISTADNEVPRLELPSFTLHVADIAAATGGVVSVNPNQSLTEAKYLMTANDFSQLPVLSNPRNLKGVISWHSIAQAELKKSDATLADATDPYPKVVYATQGLLEQIKTIHDAGFVLVRGTDQTIIGIITTADLVTQLSDLTTPFFQLGDIETKLRRCIGHVFTDISEVCDAVKAPKLTSIADMTFGQYVTLLQDPGRWDRMHWTKVPRNLFINHLDDVRKIRNRVMHFGVQLEEQDRKMLASFFHLMNVLDTT